MAESEQPGGEFVLYTTDDGRTRVECRLEDETIWLSQASIGELYDRSKQTISEHLVNLFDDGELVEQAVVRNFRTTAADGKTYDVQYYNLEAILAVGFRVRSRRGTQFRRWANTRLQEYLVKGFVMDDERLKNPAVPSASPVPDYFDELLDRIRDIRASERRMYLRVREIFTMSADYSPTDRETTQFFRIIQNKLHFAATGQTAAELIHARANAAEPSMGLTVWKGEIVRKSDVTIAKNYLQAAEIDELNRIVTMWLDFAEDQARRRKQVFLRDWQSKLDEFLAFNDRDVLLDAGRVKKSLADQKAQREYDLFAERRRSALENEGAEDTIKMLEDLARQRPDA
ncbi:MAG: virulence RhuM family protein [Abyssibacter sp.]|uniref:virulence RhuM family protein n=1 Tax=Abyssibacter sp. TaxID=2320200 RepID=UPI00321B177C